MLSSPPPCPLIPDLPRLPSSPPSHSEALVRVCCGCVVHLRFVPRGFPGLVVCPVWIVRGRVNVLGPPGLELVGRRWGISRRLGPIVVVAGGRRGISRRLGAVVVVIVIVIVIVIRGGGRG